jgi:hypothetical protein
MLAEFFDRPALPDSHYPVTIWNVLNESPPNSPTGLTRKQQLVQTWVQVKRIDSLASIDKIDRLTSQPSELLKLSIDDFEERADMLQDVRARIPSSSATLGRSSHHYGPSASLPRLRLGLDFGHFYLKMFLICPVL